MTASSTLPDNVFGEAPFVAAKGSRVPIITNIGSYVHVQGSGALDPSYWWDFKPPTNNPGTGSVSITAYHSSDGGATFTVVSDLDNSGFQNSTSPVEVQGGVVQGLPPPDGQGFGIVDFSGYTNPGAGLFVGKCIVTPFWTPTVGSQFSGSPVTILVTM